MTCRYCQNEVTPDSRLAHMGACSECSMVDEIRNQEQVELWREAIRSGQ